MQNRPVSTVERMARVVGFIAAVVIFQIYLRQLFDSPPAGSVNYLRLLCAGLMGGAGVLVGGYIGKAIAKSSRPNNRLP